MRIVKAVFGMAILAVVVVTGASVWLYRTLNSPNEHTKSNDYIVVEKGSTPNQIISKLTAEGVLSDSLAVRLYLRTFGDAGKLQAGEYRFPSPITPLDVLKQLEKGEDRTVKLTIPEGYTRFDIAKRIAEQFPQNPPIDERAILNLMDDTTLIRDLAPAAKNLEGYMYPSTYSFPPDAKPDEIIEKMVVQFRKAWKPEWSERSKQLGRTAHEIVTIASLVETESKFDQERPVVAGVIYNRLAKNIPLGIDQTAVYVAKMQDRWDGTIHKSDLEVDSPYNTRRFGGIPPGPISSVTESSIAAALNPQASDYLYYVLNVQANDGSHHFYSSAAEFERGKAEYQRWLEQQRRLKREANAGQ